MRTDITVAAHPRSTRGKNEARRLRVSGMIPAVVYGTGGTPVAVSVSPKELTRILHSATGHNTIFDVEIPGQEKSPVMIVDWQFDPVKDRLLHADLERIDLSKRLVVKIPVHTTGEPKGVKQQSGLYDVVNREIQIECLPDEIPAAFEMDVTEMMLGQSLRAKDIPLAGSMKLLSNPELVVSHVVASRATVETTEGAAAAEGAAAPATAEPEVIKKGKKEEEGKEGKKEEKKK